ncbi:hypothetical protein ACLUEY_11950 [Vreelandella aquamarina]
MLTDDSLVTLFSVYLTGVTLKDDSGDADAIDTDSPGNFLLE